MELSLLLPDSIGFHIVWILLFTLLPSCLVQCGEDELLRCPSIGELLHDFLGRDDIVIIQAGLQNPANQQLIVTGQERVSRSTSVGVVHIRVNGLLGQPGNHTGGHKAFNFSSCPQKVISLVGIRPRRGDPMACLPDLTRSGKEYVWLLHNSPVDNATSCRYRAVPGGVFALERFYNELRPSRGRQDVRKPG
ncbi:unnamed protein product [Protopolystoma xenopodis]|uniref:Uncharacterized protein n=1 Tax=Protopolystoma xenopodis TaxID=117903 RepID=A0A3S5BYE0_9PLAT|nr:unnamed protein product [Protopolystoma xenopodis]